MLLECRFGLLEEQKGAILGILRCQRASRTCCPQHLNTSFRDLLNIDMGGWKECDLISVVLALLLPCLLPAL